MIRRIAKKTLGLLFRSLPSIRFKVSRGLTVFTFHEVSDCPSLFARQHCLAVSPATFRRQAVWIKQNFNVIHPRDLAGGNAIPERAAIISFDDGFLGTFQHGLPVLEELGLPAIIFLNMQPVLEQKPMLSAMACYLEDVPEFLAFAQAVGLKRPFHLTLSPAVMQDYENHHGPVEHSAVLAYQGQFADMETLKAWDDKDLITYGNHLFQHWNACALSPEQFEQQYAENEKALALFKSRVNLFAFTNGQPGTCWTEREVSLLRGLGAGKIFSANGRVNSDPGKFLLDRVSLSEHDNDADQLWFRTGRAALNSI